MAALGDPLQSLIGYDTLMDSRDWSRVYGLISALLPQVMRAPDPATVTSSNYPQEFPKTLFFNNAAGLVYADYCESAFAVFGDKKNPGTRRTAACLRQACRLLQFIKENTNACLQVVGNWAVGFLVGACAADGRIRPADKH
jgi:hypothetical protein